MTSRVLLAPYQRMEHYIDWSRSVTRMRLASIGRLVHHPKGPTLGPRLHRRRNATTELNGRPMQRATVLEATKEEDLHTTLHITPLHLHSTVLFTPHHANLYFIPLRCTALHCTPLHSTTLSTPLHCTLHSTPLHFTALHLIALSTSLHSTAIWKKYVACSTRDWSMKESFHINKCSCATIE